MKYKNIIYSFLISIILLIIPFNIYAQTSINLIANKTDLEPGDEIILTAKTNEELELYALMATLSYAPNVFEEIETTSFTALNDTTEINYNAKTNKFGIINKIGTINNEIFQIKLKVKENPDVGETNIALTNISASDGETKEILSAASLTLLVTRDALEGETLPTNEPNEIMETQETILKTFTNKPILIETGIALGLTLIGLIILCLFKKEKKVIRNIYFVLFVILTGSFIYLVSNNIAKKDVNNDGEKTYEDAQEVLKYLLDFEGTKLEEPKETTKPLNNKTPSKNNNNSSKNEEPSVSPDYDLNNDGYVDVTDVAHSVKDTTNNTNYKVSLRAYEDESSSLPKTKATLNFYATVSPQEEIKEVMVNNKFYPVTNNGDYYSIVLDALTQTGEQEFVFTKVKLSNHRLIDTKLVIKKTVLKALPYVDMFEVNDENNTLNFVLEDIDQAFIEGKILVIDEEGNQIISEELLKNNHINEEFSYNKTYTIFIYATYNLGNNNDQTYYFENKEIYRHSFTLAKNYDFTISNVTITDAIQKDAKPLITFNSTNAFGFAVESIVVNGQNYKVTLQKENYYEVALNELDTSKYGKYHLDIEKVILDNLKNFTRENDYNTNTLTYNVLKKMPTVKYINITDESNNKTLTASYEFNDEDEALINLKAVLVDSTDKIVSQVDVLNPQENVTLSYASSNDGYYKIKFLADVNLGTDRHDYQSELIGEEEIITQAEIYIISAQAKELYPTKGEPKYTITYQAYVSDSIKNKYSELAGITINGLNYDGAKGNNYTSTISFTVPSESGIIDLKATRIKLRAENYQGTTQEYFSVTPYITQIDVLKSLPTIEDFKVIAEDYNQKTVTFEFNVVDDKGGFEIGELEFNTESKTINRGNNKITFENVYPDKNFTLNFYGTYDLDTNTLVEEENKNRYVHHLIHSVNYGLYTTDFYNDLKLTDVNIVSKNNNQYFAKGEPIQVNFNITGLSSDLNLDVSQVLINNKAYAITKSSTGYYITLESSKTAGVKELTISQVTLTNGKTITLKEPVSLNFEILKTPASISSFDYSLANDTINMHFSLKDLDETISNYANIKVNIYDENHTLLKTLPFNENLSFAPIENLERYYITVLASYDLDSTLDNNNYYSDIKLLDEVISLAHNNIAIKNILDINLYQQEENKTELKDEILLSTLEANLSSYFVELKLEDMPTIHVKILKAYVENAHLKLVLDYKNVTQNGQKSENLIIDFGPINEEGLAINANHPETFAHFIEEIKNNPHETFTLTGDLDASTYTTSDNAYINIDFSGTLDGQGYTIKNLTKPLFDNINKGTVKNLKINNVLFPSSEAHGALANTAKVATITKVLISGYSKSGSEAQTGTLIGRAISSTISNCRVKDFNLSVGTNLQQVGGLVGILENSTIENSYAVGNMSGNWNFIGGLVGDVLGNSTISHSFTKVKMSNSGGVSCSLACSYTGNLTVKDNLTLSTGFRNGLANNYTKNSTNNYQVVDSIPESTNAVINYIPASVVNTALVQNILNFSPEIWNLKNISWDNYPTFNIEKTSKLNMAEVEDMYDENKEILYNNLALLMPYFDSKKIVESALAIPETEILAQVELLHIIPIDENGNIVTYLTSSQPNKIKKLKLIFKNNEKSEYEVRFDKTTNNLAIYRISSLKIDYIYNHYIINEASQLVNNLTNYLANLTYENNLDTLTPTADSRIYRDYYNEVTKKELKEFVLKYLSNSNYTNTTNNEAIDEYLEKEIKKSQKLEKVLYTYNYFKRFYSVSLDGVMLNDLVLFGLQGFSSNLNALEIANQFLSNSNNINTNETNNTYNRLFAKYTNLENITDFLAYFVKELTEQEPAEWYAKAFKGYLTEISVPERDDITYTLWSHISNPDTVTKVSWYNYALPILTLPERAAYIISTPTQFIIGAQRTYIDNPFDETKEQALINRIESYANRMETYYTTASKILESAKYFNDIHTVQIDKRYAYDLNGILTFQNPYSTEEPFHKNFNEVLGQWAYNDYNAATANGAYIIWRVEGVMDGVLEEGSEYTYHTWSHETAHNIDARLFLKNYGRRFDAGGEDYADSNLMQAFGENDIVMNLSRTFAPNTKIGSNLTPERIDSLSEIKDFYGKLFDTIYIIDYLEGKAFLALTPEEQSYIAVQASYPNLTKEEYQSASKQYLQYKYTVYQTISAAEFAQMSLNTFDDLYTNKLVIFPGVIYSTYTDNRYGGEGITKAHWYQPHNNYGRPDSYSIKWFAYEMLGYKGYIDGYIEYFSNIHSIEYNGFKDYKTDLMALRTITSDEDMTFKKYKHMRFAEVEANLENIQIISVNDAFNQFYEALKADANHVKEVEEAAWAKYPDNTDEAAKKRNELISEARQYKNSTALRKELFYALKNGTNDFINKVYDSTNKQPITDFVIPKLDESINLPESSPNELPNSFEETLEPEITLPNEEEELPEIPLETPKEIKNSPKQEPTFDSEIGGE